MKKINIPNFLLAILAFGGIMVSSCKKEQVVKIQNSPGPNFDVSSSVIKPGQSVNFTSTSTGEISTYIWSFPGGEPNTSKEKDPQGIKYAKPGKYTVSLTTNGPSGSNTVSRLELITVEATTEPIIVASSKVIKPEDSVNFSITSPVELTAYKWSFPGGEPSTSTEKEPKGIKYAKPGKYTVNLTTSGPSGSFTISMTDLVFVNALDLVFNFDPKDSIQNYSPSSSSMPMLIKTGTITNFNPKLKYQFYIVFSTKVSDPYYPYDNNGNYNYYYYYAYVRVESNGKFSLGFPITEKTTNYRIYSSLGESEAYSQTLTFTAPKPTIIINSGPTLLFNNTIGISGKLSGPFSYYRIGVCWKSGSGPAVYDPSFVNSALIDPNSSGDFNETFNINESGSNNIRLFYMIGTEVFYFDNTYNINIPVAPTTFNFDNGFFPSNWNQGQWSINSSSYYSAYYSIANPQYSSNYNNSTSFSVNLSQESTLSFFYRTFDFSSSDNFSVLIDGTANYISTSSSWSNYSVPISAGPHTISFRVLKNSSSSSWATGVYVDNVSY